MGSIKVLTEGTKALLAKQQQCAFLHGLPRRTGQYRNRTSLPPPLTHPPTNTFLALRLVPRDFSRACKERRQTDSQILPFRRGRSAGCISWCQLGL